MNGPSKQEIEMNNYQANRICLVCNDAASGKIELQQLNFSNMEKYVSFKLNFKDNIMVFQVAKHARRSSNEQFKEP